MTMFTYEEIDELGDGLMRSYLGDKAGSVLRADIEGFTENYLRLPVSITALLEMISISLDSFQMGLLLSG